jgi:putative two-component system response regulator
MAGHHILVVDDNRPNVLLLEEVLTRQGHRVEVAANGLEALAQIHERCPELILLDLDMPYMDGYEVCRRVKNNPATRLIPIIIVTAETAFDAKLRALELGADDFLSKPFKTPEVVARCRSLLRVKGLIDELDSAEAVVFAFARAIEVKSAYTVGHAERVARYALSLAAHVRLPEEKWETLRKGALLHDIGKMSIPDAILDKHGPLTPAEFETVKQHTVQGARIVEPLRSIRDAVPLIRWHHERLDGRGYPDGLRGADIPLLVRLLAVADVYDSLASKRPYRSAIPHDFCLELLRSNAANGGLDPWLVDRFCALPELGTPAALAGLDRIWNIVPPQPALAPSTNGRTDAEGETRLDALPRPEDLSHSWSWQSIKKMRTAASPPPGGPESAAREAPIPEP